MQINDNIKLIRELSGLKQADFAKLIKTNLSNLKTYENTDVRPKANVVFEIAQLAGVPIEDLEKRKLTPEDLRIKVDKVENGTNLDPANQTFVKYVSLLEKTVSEKEADIKTYRSAIDKITSIDKDLIALKSTVSGFSNRLEDAEANVEDLREFVIRQLAKIRGESTAKVAAELGNVSVELLRKNQKKDTQHDSGR